jgi:hypothetical protein
MRFIPPVANWATSHCLAAAKFQGVRAAYTSMGRARQPRVVHDENFYSAGSAGFLFMGFEVVSQWSLQCAALYACLGNGRFHRYDPAGGETHGGICAGDWWRQSSIGGDSRLQARFPPNSSATAHPSKVPVCGSRALSPVPRPIKSRINRPGSERQSDACAASPSSTAAGRSLS